MHEKTRRERKAAAARRNYRDLLAADAAGAMIPHQEIRRAREVYRIRRASAEVRGVEL